MDQKVIDFLQFFTDIIGFLAGNKGQFVSYGWLDFVQHIDILTDS